MFTPTVLDLSEDVVPCISSRGDITAGVKGSRVTQRTQTSAVLGWAELDYGDGAAFQTGRSDAC